VKVIATDKDENQKKMRPRRTTLVSERLRFCRLKTITFPPKRKVSSAPLLGRCEHHAQDWLERNTSPSFLCFSAMKFWMRIPSLATEIRLLPRKGNTAVFAKTCSAGTLEGHMQEIDHLGRRIELLEAKIDEAIVQMSAVMPAIIAASQSLRGVGKKSRRRVW